VVEYWKSKGMAAVHFFPPWASHGAATAEGQAGCIGALRKSIEADHGVPGYQLPVKVVSLGSTSDGIEAFMDKNAFDSDGCDAHWPGGENGTPISPAKIESGLVQNDGHRGWGNSPARAAVSHVPRTSLGWRKVIPHRGAGKVLGSGRKIPSEGLAILEDANHNTGQITGCGPWAENGAGRKRNCSPLVKSWMGRVSVFPLDILILDEKSVRTSAARGMDTKSRLNRCC